MYSQSYPIQRVEGSDTLVIMTKAQASAMNARFLQMKSEIQLHKQEYSYLKAVADSLTALNVKNKVVLYRVKENAAEAEKMRREQSLAAGIFLTWISLILVILNG